MKSNIALSLGRHTLLEQFRLGAEWGLGIPIRIDPDLCQAQKAYLDEDSRKEKPSRPVYARFQSQIQSLYETAPCLTGEGAVSPAEWRDSREGRRILQLGEILEGMAVREAIGNVFWGNPPARAGYWPITPFNAWKSENWSRMAPHLVTAFGTPGVEITLQEGIVPRLSRAKVAHLQAMHALFYYPAVVIFRVRVVGSAEVPREQAVNMFFRIDALLVKAYGAGKNEDCENMAEKRLPLWSQIFGIAMHCKSIYEGFQEASAT